MLVIYPAMAPTRHRAPLTRATLHAIGERNRGNADVSALLWEITLGMLVGALRRELDGEPAVLEQQAQTEALLAKTRRR